MKKIYRVANLLQKVFKVHIKLYLFSNNCTINLHYEISVYYVARASDLPHSTSIVLNYAFSIEN